MSQIVELLLLLLPLFQCTTAIELENFYNFGPKFGDSHIESSWIDVGETRVRVNVNGDINIQGGSIILGSYYAYHIPFQTFNGGHVWFRNSTNPNTTERARALTDIQRASHHVTHIDYLFVVTWDHIYSPSSYKSNTFQAVVATSGGHLYAIFLYSDGLLQWISPDGGLSNYQAAIVGFQAIIEYDGVVSLTGRTVDGSGECSIIHIASRSNVGVPGMFVIPAVLFHYECEEGDVRLVDSNMNTSASGRVEMCLDNDWRVVRNGTWGVEEASVVCTQLGLPSDEVFVGWNLRSAGVPVNCSGNETGLKDCHIGPPSLTCRGGATTTTCLKYDDCDRASATPAVCLNRYGSCVPFSLYLLGSGIPCDGVYEAGTDYVYIRKSREPLMPLNVIGDIEELLDLNDFCASSTVRMICHYYLPPCGNSTHFEPPTSVCSDACHLQSQMCSTSWQLFETGLRQMESNPLNCSLANTVLYPLNNSCSDLGVNENVVMITLERKEYQVKESEGEVEVCATLNSTYDVECAVPNGLHIKLSVLSGTADTKDDYDNIQILDFGSCKESACSSISIVDDGTAEIDESFIISMARTPGMDNRILLNSETVVVTIEDDDDIVVGFNSMGTYTTTETEGYVTVCVDVLNSFSGKPHEPFSAIMLPEEEFETNNAADDCYKMFDFTTDDSQKCHNYSIPDDDECENQTVFKVRLSVISTQRQVGLFSNLSVATIVVDDAQEPECLAVSEVTRSSIRNQSTTEITATMTAVLVASVLGVIVAVVVIALYLRRVKNKRWRNLGSYDYCYSESRQTNILKHLREQLENKRMIYSKDQIELTTTVGQGETGLVYKGYIKTAIGKELVAVKTGKALFSTGDLETLAKEVSTMLSFKHINIMSLIGVCVDREMPLLIMPFMTNGSVLDYVRNNRDKLLITGQFLQEEVQSACRTLLRMCVHIAKGMEYLSLHKFVHRDLAARNCMIDREGTIKVADFGLTENNYSNNYFHRRINETQHEEKVPIRWMAPESMENSVYTEATDVWSYGVTMWEMFTCGRVPYAGIHAVRLLKELRKGERLEKPENNACHDDIYDVMLACWAMEPGERPNFSDLVVTVNDLLERHAGYLELSQFSSCKMVASPEMDIDCDLKFEGSSC